MGLPKHIRFKINKGKPSPMVFISEAEKQEVIQQILAMVKQFLPQLIPSPVKGDVGATGQTGESVVGKSGNEGLQGEGGTDGANGVDGVDGEDGKDGKDGETPTDKKLVEMMDAIIEPKMKEIQDEVMKIATKGKKVGGGGGGSDSFATITATQNITVNTKINLVDATSANVIVTLPTAITSARREYHIKKIDSSNNTVTIATAGSETIDDGSTAVIDSQYESVRLYSDGSNFHII